jgi:hypothetical protein
VLSERDARALRRIEQRLWLQDPEFAARMAQPLPDGPSWVRRLVPRLVLVLLVATAVVSVLLGVVSLGLVAATLFVVLWRRRSRRAPNKPRLHTRVRDWWSEKGS